MSVETFTIDIDLPQVETMIKKLGLEPSGKVQRFFTNEVMRRADRYVPFRTGVMKNSAHASSDYTGIIYVAPYARYLWYGKLMVDPITGKGAFHDPISGRFWSRPGVNKVLTDRDLEFNGAPMRGSHWVERMWTAEGNEITDSVEKYIYNIYDNN